MKSMRNYSIINPYSDDDNAVRKLAITIQVVILLIVLGISPLVSLPQIMLGLGAILIITLLLAWQKIVWPGQIITPVAIAATSTIFMLNGNGTHDVALIGLTGAIIVAGLFLGERGTIAASIVTALIMVAVGIAQMTGIFIPIAPEAEEAIEEIVISVAMLVGVGLSLRTTLNRLRIIAIKARENEAAQIEANRGLLDLQSTLETRVSERTSELEKRASQLETIAQVARSISTIQDLDRLLPAITTVVSEQFGFYHVGIFLLDERAEYAVLEAANSEGGQRMRKRGHRLRLGTTGIVGYVAAQGEPRIALDVGADAVYFNNPDLPNTRSEIALPLKAGNNIIGVLDVQSTETNAFKPEDISVLNTLANQVAIAIENARLLSQTRKALAESQNIYDEYIKREWSQFGRKLGKLGFLYDGIRTVPVSDGRNTTSASATQIPVKVRGVTIGSLQIQSNDPHRQWSQDELNLVRAAAERAGLAIENVRLLDEAQRRAAKERTIGEISARIASSIDMNGIMQTAVEELGRALPGSEIVLQFESKSDTAQQEK